MQIYDFNFNVRRLCSNLQFWVVMDESTQSIRSQLDNLQLIVKVDSHERLLKYVYCKPLMKSTSHNTRFICYCVLLCLNMIVASINKNFIVQIIINVINAIIFILMIIECNIFMIKQALCTFTIYYICFNTAVATFALRMVENYKYDVYGCGHDDTFPHSACKANAFIVAILDTCSVFIVSIIDGYQLSRRFKFCLVWLAIVYYCYHYIATILNANDTEDIKLFGYEYKSIHSIIVSASSTVIIFILRQAYYIIKRPNKSILIPAHLIFVEKNAVNQRSDDHQRSLVPVLLRNENINNSSTAVIDNNTIANIEIDTVETVFYKILVNILCISNQTASVLSVRFNSRIVWMLIFVFVIALYGIRLFIGIPGFGLYLAADIVGLLCFLIPILCNLNFEIFKYTLQSSFVFWWRVQDTVALLAVEVLIRYSNKINVFSVEPTDEAITISIFNLLQATNGMIFIFLIHGVFLKTRYKVLFILWGIYYWLQTSYTAFFSTDDYEIIFFENTHYQYVVSCRIIVISKSIDTTIWLIVQLINQIRVPHGIIATAKVTRHWVRTYNVALNDYNQLYLNN